MTLILITNEESRQHVFLYFNDHVMALGAILGIYFATRNQIELAAFFIALGHSVKAGMLLILPVLLGWT